MSSLINTKIQDTYTGLIKTADNAPITATLKNLEDGNGGVLPIQVSTTGVNFTGNVTGITAGGLAAGTGTDSIASVLTATPAIASNADTIAIGKGAQATNFFANAYGASAVASGSFAQAIGTYCEASGSYGVSLGTGCNASGNISVAVGKQSAASAANSISMGIESNCSNQNGIAIGYLAVANASSGDGSVAIGWNVKTVRDAGVAVGRNLNQSIGNFDHYRPINIGSGGNVRGGDVIGIGTNVDIQGTGTNDKIAIGNAAVVTDVNGAVALGAGVTASKADTVSVKELETTVNGGGIIMHSPNGTEYKLTVSDAGALVITAV